MRHVRHDGWHSVTWQSKVGGLIILLGFVPAFSFYAGMQYQSLVDSDHAVQDLQAQNALIAGPAPVPEPQSQVDPYPSSTPPSASALPNTAAPNLPISQSFASTNQTYIFTLYKLPSKDSCAYTLQKTGKSVDISQLIGTAELPCSKTQSGLSSSFKKWLNDSVFTIVVRGVTLQIDALNMTVKTL